MTLITSLKTLQAWRKTVELVALIPTMGNLHAGHLKLVEEAKKHTPHVIVSIFVNPLQFGQGEDFSHYPRTLDADMAKLKQVGIDFVFSPNEKMLYPHIQQYYIEPPAIQHELCGASRPGHFRGVATVVAKLFHLIQPQFAVFGKKDFQQLFIIKNMVADLNFPVTILAVNTGRAEDGLALSSRNQYLSTNERSEAPHLYQQLCAIKAAIINMQARDYLQLAKKAQADLTQRGWQVDYIEVRCRHTLQPASPHDKELVILIAARLGKTRLIDNIEVDISERVG